MMEDSDTQPLVGQPKVWTCTLLVAISVAVIGSSLQFGFQTGCMANTQGTLRDHFKDVSDTFMSLIISGVPIGGLFGGLSAGIIADKVGRKKCMMLNNVPVLIGTVLMSVAWNKYFFLIGRIFIGFGCGIATGVAPMYISEISPVSVKGAIGVSHQFMITFGILIAFVMSIKGALSSFSEYWHMYFAFPALPALYQLILLPLCPESPNWLYYNKEREDLARAALTKLRNSRSVADQEVDAMIKERTTATSSVMVSYKQLFSDRTLRLTLIIGLALQGAQQLSGVNAILNYGPDILKTAGLTNPDLGTGLLGGINVFMTFVSVPLMDKLGRRSLMLLGQGGMILSFIGLAIAQKIHYGSPDGSSWTAPVSVATVVTFIIFFAVGPGSIPWLIIAEIFTADARGKASSLCVGANWVCNLLVVLTYDQLNKALSPNTFFLYTGIVTFFFIFTIFFVPETKKKPVEQIVREIKTQAEKFPPTVF
ncbi:facilitated glucose transporter protein 1-like isoform X3 [Bolinopsis microptera]|uniref:facilitated glucose transporter protein 1-like isoform X3 n=1 Tax=Bolinopsis microptera TaxID=2820187 RepID=UPI00307928F8